jgi:tetratricopeptide (TPR) repeat protein
LPATNAATTAPPRTIFFISRCSSGPAARSGRLPQGRILILCWRDAAEPSLKTIALALLLAALPRLDAGLTDAFRHVRAGRYEDGRRAAEAYLAKPGAAHPGQAEFVIGLSYHQQKLYESARERFARAVLREPAYVTARFFLGFALLNLGRLDEARRELEAYVAADPSHAEAHFGLGLVALEQDRAADARAAIERAIAIASAGSAATSPAVRRDLARYEARLADAHLRDDRLEPARDALLRSVALWPDLFEPWHKLARVRRRLGDAAGAAEAQARSEELFRRRTGDATP